MDVMWNRTLFETLSSLFVFCSELTLVNSNYCFWSRHRYRYVRILMVNYTASIRRSWGWWRLQHGKSVVSYTCAVYTWEVMKRMNELECLECTLTVGCRRQIESGQNIHCSVNSEQGHDMIRSFWTTSDLPSTQEFKPDADGQDRCTVRCNTFVTPQDLRPTHLLVSPRCAPISPNFKLIFSICPYGNLLLMHRCKLGFGNISYFLPLLYSEYYVRLTRLH